nr:MAG TPA: hypothetical protein [Caudoviricetes sp.]
MSCRVQIPTSDIRPIIETFCSVNKLNRYVSAT